MKKVFCVLFGLLLAAMVNADSSKSEVKLNKDDRWFELSRPYLEELRPMEDLDLDAYVRDMVSTAKDFNANTLVMMADDGGYPLYPSKLAPINSHIHGKDLLAMIERECRAKGLRFGLGHIGVHTNSYIAATKPDWAQRKKNGGVFSFFHWHLLCINSPYGEYYRELVKEALQRYSVDYLYLEGQYFRRPACYCSHCKKKFLSAYGKELEKASSEEMLAFINTSLTDYQASVKAMAQEVSPQTVVVSTSYQNLFGITDLKTFPKHTDMLAIENQWGFGGDGGGRLIQQAGLDILRHRAYAPDGIMAGTWWISMSVDLNYHQRTPAHARLSFMQNLAYGATVQPHIQSVMGVEKTLLPVVRELFTCVENVRPHLLDTELMPYIGVIDGPHAYGYCNVLLEKHMPFEIIPSHDLTYDRLKRYKCVALGNNDPLDKDAIDALKSYINNGGGFICGGRLPADLADLMELEIGKDRPKAPWGWPKGYRLPRYYRFDSEDGLFKEWKGRLISNQRSSVEVTASKPWKTLAKIIDIRPDALHKDHMAMKPYPGKAIGPMVLTRDFGKGRLFYTAANLAAQTMPGKVLNGDVAEILGQALRWTANHDAPLQTNAPPTVQIIPHVKDGKMVIFVNNLTVDQTKGITGIRYVVPISDIEIDLKLDGKAKKVEALTGKPVSMKQTDQGTKISIPKLNEYEILVIDLK